MISADNCLNSGVPASRKSSNRAASTLVITAPALWRAGRVAAHHTNSLAASRGMHGGLFLHTDAGPYKGQGKQEGENPQKHGRILWVERIPHGAV